MATHHGLKLPTTNTWDLTLPLDGVIRTYGNDASTLFHPKLVTPDQLQWISRLEVSPHAVPHLDFPASLKAWLRPEHIRGTNVPSYLTYQGPTDIAVFRTLIVDMTDRARIMRATIQKAEKEGRFEGIPTRPIYCWEEGEFRELYNSMAITRQQIEWITEMKPEAVLFYTSWRQFAPIDGNIKSLDFIPWHPYLLHPYLVEEAGEYLLSSPVGPRLKAIGCDLYGLDTPLRYLVLLGDTPLDSKRLDSRLKNDLESLPAARAEDAPYHWWSLHRRALLQEQAMLLENLDIPPELFAHPPRQTIETVTRCIEGNLLVFPFIFGNNEDTALVSVQFVAASSTEVTANGSIGQ